MIVRCSQLLNPKNIDIITLKPFVTLSKSYLIIKILKSFCQPKFQIDAKLDESNF